MALNKADIVAPDTIAAIKRQLTLNGAREVVVISSNHPETLKPLLDQVGSLLAKDLLTFSTERDVREEVFSGIA